MRLLFCVALFLYMSCNTNKTADRTSENVNSTGAGMDQQLQISATFLSVQQMEKKFKMLAIIENETGVTSFSKGDTVSLYPNFIRGEGKQLDKKSVENEHMKSLKNLVQGHSFKASVKIQGSGKNRYGLIMNWEKN